MVIQALQFPVYIPAMRVIIAITNTNPASITTSFDGINPANHGYLTGTIVRIDVPNGYGMTQINQQFGPITVTSPTTFTIPIDAIAYDVFVFPNTFPENRQEAQSVPIGEDNGMLTAATFNQL